jgi:hypothetical protein
LLELRDSELLRSYCRLNPDPINRCLRPTKFIRTQRDKTGTEGLFLWMNKCCGFRVSFEGF